MPPNEGEKYFEPSSYEPASLLLETLKEIEEIDTTGILKYVDQHIGDTYHAIGKAAKVGAYRLLHYEELPNLWQENPYILSGYRFLSTKRECLLSIFYLHNETCNIWTHLLGTVFFFGLGIYAFNTHLQHATVFDKLVFAIFFVAAAKCLICSVFYHVFMHCARISVMKCAATFDYIGISILITASILIMEYYSLYCSPSACAFYMAFTSLMGLIPILCSVLFPWWDTTEYRMHRVGMFILLSSSGIIPLIHLSHLHGAFHVWHLVSPMITSLIAYLTGVWVYANRFPECKWPGKLDRFGIHSHSVWHVFVCLGIYEHYRASLWFFERRFSGCGTIG